MRSERPDLVVLDIILGPGEMTGWDVAREKLLDPAIRSIPLIVVSGLAADAVREGGRAASDALSGAMLILSKPIDADVLERAVAAVIAAG
jgi:CheY-like chemotaxis protein